MEKKDIFWGDQDFYTIILRNFFLLHVIMASCLHWLKRNVSVRDPYWGIYRCMIGWFTLKSSWKKNTPQRKKKSQGREKKQKFLKLYDSIYQPVYFCVPEHFLSKKWRGTREGRKDTTVHLLFVLLRKWYISYSFPWQISLYISLTKTTGSLCLEGRAFIEQEKPLI